MSVSSREDSETPVWRFTPALIVAMPSGDATAPETASPSPELFPELIVGQGDVGSAKDALSNVWGCRLPGTALPLQGTCCHPLCFIPPGVGKAGR